MGRRRRRGALEAGAATSSLLDEAAAEAVEMSDPARLAGKELGEYR
jgi:hypothetical protein